MRRIVVVLVFLISALVLTQAQAQQSSVAGRILDPSGKALAHAAVTLRNALSGAARQTESGAGGEYSFSGIEQGEYILTAAASGFAAETRSVSVKSSSAANETDISLSVASVQQTVAVVSGSRVEELQQDSPQPVDVVTKQRIDRTGFESVADVLSEMPGVVTRNNASYSGSSQEMIDGVASQDVLVLQDGLPIVGARGINSGIIDLDEQNIGRLDRIEVVRGAASSLYGTDAIGGVINMITHEPTHPFEGGPARLRRQSSASWMVVWTWERNLRSSPHTLIWNCIASILTRLFPAMKARSAQTISVTMAGKAALQLQSESVYCVLRRRLSQQLHRQERGLHRRCRLRLRLRREPR